jgi:hypothetical protein
MSPRLRAAPGEKVDGWVEGSLYSMVYPGKAGGEIEHVQINAGPSFYVGSVPIYPPTQVRYSSPTLTTCDFAFIVTEYPSGRITLDDIRTWNSAGLFDFLWRSDRFVCQSDSNKNPIETPALRKVVDDFVQALQNAGWQLVPGVPRIWWGQCDLRKRYNEVGVQLNWK